MQRRCRYEPLSAQPLVLVLCQVRFSPVRQMEQYIPAIQDVFRRNGFPIERAGKVQQVTFGPGDGAPVQVVEQQRWEYRNREETWSIIVMQDSVIQQTTAYTRFEAFAEQLKLCVHTVLAESEQDRFGVVQRVGLRYVDVVRPRSGKGYRFSHGVRLAGRRRTQRGQRREDRTTAAVCGPGSSLVQEPALPALCPVSARCRRPGPPRPSW